MPGVSPQLQRYHLATQTPSLGLDISYLHLTSSTVIDTSFIPMSKLDCGHFWLELVSTMSSFLENLLYDVEQKGLELGREEQRHHFSNFVLELHQIQNVVQQLGLQSSKLEFEYDGECLLPSSTSHITIIEPEHCYSLRSQEGLSCPLLEIFDRLTCVTEFLASSPFHITAHPTLAQSLEAALVDRIHRSASASSARLPQPITMEARLSVTRREDSRRLPILHFVGRYLGNYGHLLLDNLFGLYVHLAAHDSLDQPLAMVVSDWPEPTYHWPVGSIFDQMAHALFEAVAVGTADVSTMVRVSQGVYLASQGAVTLDEAVRGANADNHRRFLQDSAAPNIMYARPEGDW